MVWVPTGPSQCDCHGPCHPDLSGDNSISCVALFTLSHLLCQVFTHSNIITFEGTYFSLHKTVGTYLLFQGVDNFESHIRLWNCSKSTSGVNHASCACGLVAREGNEVVQVDVCDTRHSFPILPSVRLENLSDRVVQTRVFELRQGRSLRFEFPSGRVFTIHLEQWGLSITVQSIGADTGMTRCYNLTYLKA